MPATVAELYATASDAMLARSGSASKELRQLLQCVFFEAHCAHGRVIEEIPDFLIQLFTQFSFAPVFLHICAGNVIISDQYRG